MTRSTAISDAAPSVAAQADPARPGGLGRGWRGLPGPVARLLLWPVLKRAALVLLLIEAVFLAESFEGLMVEVLRHDGSWSGLGWLLLLYTPRIADLSLAIALLIALHFSLRDARDRGELLILAGAGMHWLRLPGFALLLGLFAGVTSGAVALLAVPWSERAEAKALDHLAERHLRQQLEAPLPAGQFRQLGPVTVYTMQGGRLIVHEAQALDGLRVTLAESHRLVRAAQTGGYDLHLSDVTALSLRPGLASQAAPQGAPQEAPPPAPPPVLDLAQSAEATVQFSLPGHAAGADAAPPPPGRAVARAMLAPLAALLALVSLRGLSLGPVARLLALPAALLWLIGCDLALRLLLTPLSGSALLGVSALCLCLTLGPPVLPILRRGEQMMLAQRGA